MIIRKKRVGGQGYIGPLETDNELIGKKIISIIPEQVDLWRNINGGSVRIHFLGRQNIKRSAA